MKRQLNHGLSNGLTFGIVSIFLFLIGFLPIAGGIIKDALHNGSFQAFGFDADTFDMLIFWGLLGLWAGSVGGRRLKNEPDTWLTALVGGTAAGLVHGLLIGGLAFLVGSLNDAGVRISVYLSAVLPATIKLFLVGKDTLPGSLFEFSFMLLTGVLGGLLAFAMRGQWRRAFADWRSRTWKEFLQRPKVHKIRGHPAFMPVVYVLILFVIFLIPLQIGQYWNYTLGTVGIYVLLGLGLNIVVGLAGLLDLGYVAFFAIGAYTVALLTAPSPQHLLWSFWVAVPIGIVLAASAGILLGIPVLRMRGDYLAIVTLGFGEIIRILATSDLLTPFSGGPKGVSDIGGPTLFGKPFSSDIDFVYLILLGVLLAIFVTIRLRSSRVGRAWEAMREDETVAGAMGINTLTHKLMAFAIGAAFAGLGGVLFASRNQFTGPEDHNLMVSINVLSVVIVGGMGSIPGVIAGAFVLKGLPEVLRELENYRVLAFGALLVVMMIWRPEGLFPATRRSMERHKQQEEEGREAESPGGKTS